MGDPCGHIWAVQDELGRPFCAECGASWSIKFHKSAPRHDLSTVAKRNAFYSSDEYRNMTTAEKCAVQGDGFINDYD